MVLACGLEGRGRVGGFIHSLHYHLVNIFSAFDDGVIPSACETTCGFMFAFMFATATVRLSCNDTLVFCREIHVSVLFTTTVSVMKKYAPRSEEGTHSAFPQGQPCRESDRVVI